MNTLYVGIDIAKAKLDVAFTIDGKTTFEYSIFQNDAKKTVVSYYSLP